MGMLAIFFHDEETFEQIVSIPSIEGWKAIVKSC